MTMADVDRLFKYWAKYPPLRDLVAGFVGFEIPKFEAEDDAPKYMTSDDLRRLMAMTGGRISGMG
jgi:hypothetical protein